MNDFKECDINDLSFNPFNTISKDWMLITAKNSEGKINTMTASWGGVGVLWGKNVAMCFIRPQRYTKKFVEDAESLSLCFFDNSYKKTLSYLGSVSGKDENKIAKSGLQLTNFNNVPIFKESYLNIIGKKLYKQDFLPDCFINNSLDEKWYPNKDYHTMYILEIEKVLMKG